MGTLASDMAYGLAQLIKVQGGTVSYTNVTSLTNQQNPGVNPPTVMNLVVNGLTTSGLGLINFRAAILTGRLVAGDKFTIAGDPTVYTLTADALSPLTGPTLTGVAFTPVLTTTEADGAAVSLTFSAQYNVQALITDFPAYLINGTSIQSKDHKIRALASAFAQNPVIGDAVQLPSGEIQKVIRTMHMELQGVHYGWSLQVRS